MLQFIGLQRVGDDLATEQHMDNANMAKVSINMEFR